MGDRFFLLLMTIFAYINNKLNKNDTLWIKKF